MTGSPTLADPGELIVSCTDCHNHAMVPVAVLVPRYFVDTPFPDVLGAFRCSVDQSGTRREMSASTYPGDDLAGKPWPKQDAYRYGHHGSPYPDHHRVVLKKIPHQQKDRTNCYNYEDCIDDPVCRH